MDSSPSTFDVTAASFDASVLQRSSEVPVLVDFWAPWCGPCRTLGPILERLAGEANAPFELVKINSDENQDLATRYGVQGIPNVLLFKDGEPVDRFVGVLPERQIRAFLRRHCPTEADRHMADAARHAEAGDPGAARGALEAALALDPELMAAHLALARLTLLEGDLKASRRHLETIPARADEYEAAGHLLEGVQLIEEAWDLGTLEDCERRLEADPGDLEARYASGGHELARGHYRESLEHYLALAQADREWRNQAARRAMVKVFHIVGVRDPLSDELRGRLARIYY
ncbi:MAG: thioredoxin [Acidobacteriota bacterium]